jgi:hypothetical protein
LVSEESVRKIVDFAEAGSAPRLVVDVIVLDVIALLLLRLLPLPWEEDGCSGGVGGTDTPESDELVALIRPDRGAALQLLLALRLGDVSSIWGAFVFFSVVLFVLAVVVLLVPMEAPAAPLVRTVSALLLMLSVVPIDRAELEFTGENGTLPPPPLLMAADRSTRGPQLLQRGSLSWTLAETVMTGPLSPQRPLSLLLQLLMDCPDFLLAAVVVILRWKMFSLHRTTVSSSSSSHRAVGVILGNTVGAVLVLLLVPIMSLTVISADELWSVFVVVVSSITLSS